MSIIIHILYILYNHIHHISALRITYQVHMWPSCYPALNFLSPHIYQEAAFPGVQHQQQGKVHFNLDDEHQEAEKLGKNAFILSVANL